MAGYVYNPIKEETDGVRAKRAIWSTASINLALDGLKLGKKLFSNPFYENNTKLLKGDLVYERTPEEEEEYLKCMNDIIYFTKYCQLMTPEGIKNIELRDYQVEYLKAVEKNQLNIFLACRQCGKTTTSAIFMLWYILFNVDKNSLVLGNKRKTAVEILDKIKKIFYELPYWLKPGVFKWNESEIVFDNGCRCMCEATTINSGISFTFHCVLSDEFAHIQPNILDKFYNNLFPTITAGKAKFLITSTQNGYNLFYRLWTAAENGDNDYAPFKVDWWQVPEWDPEQRKFVKRDETWHQRQIANYGGEEEFNKQFGTNFDLSASTLIAPKFIREQQRNAIKFVNMDLLGVSNSDSWFFKPDIDIEYFRSRYFVIMCDLAEGVGSDYTIFNIIEIRRENGEWYYETVGYFRNNKLSLVVAEHSLRDFCSLYMPLDQYTISMEYNTYGELFFRYVMEDLNTGGFNDSTFNEGYFVKYETGRKGVFTTGVKINHQNKSIACNQFKRLYESRHYQCYDVRFITELSNFSDLKGNGSYAASFGHDDMVMSAVELTLANDSLAIKYMKEDIENGVQKTNEIYNPYAQSSPFSQMGVPVKTGGLYDF